MLNTNSPQIITLETLDAFKNEFLTSVHLMPSSDNLVNSIVQIDANVDKNTFISNILKVKDSVIFGTNHSANTLSNVFIAGRGNIATSNNQTILGQFNSPNSDGLFIVGSGTSASNRKNSLVINKNGSVNIKDLLLDSTADTVNISAAKDIVINNKLKVVYDIIFNTDAEFCNAVDQLNDNDVITAKVAKQLTKALRSYLQDISDLDNNIITTDISNLKTWQTNLVQDLSYVAEDADTKALSVTAGQQLKTQIDNKNDANISNIQNQINELKQQISYLVSCLTVDKISNNNTEFYAVGVADFALDADTKLKILPTNS